MSLTKKQLAVDKIFKPNDEGISNWVDRIVFSEEPELNWGNNGNGRHGVYFADNRYIWEKQGSHKVTALRLNGFNTDKLHGASRPIRSDIHAYHKQFGCVVCGSNSDLVTDHKNDLYNDPRVLDSKTQTLDDFQCLCNHCNLQKRQIARVTRETELRYGATHIPLLNVFGVDFIYGDDTFDKNDVNAMVGTYWYDPIAFMTYIKNNLVNVTEKKNLDVSTQTEAKSTSDNISVLFN